MKPEQTPGQATVPDGVSVISPMRRWKSYSTVTEFLERSPIGRASLQAAYEAGYNDAMRRVARLKGNR